MGIEQSRETSTLKLESVAGLSTGHGNRTVRAKAATNSDVQDSESSKEKFYYSHWFIKKKDAKT